MGVHARRIHANGIGHHVLEWEGDAARTVVVLHGYLDLARTFTRVAEALAAPGRRVLVPDLRGHGETDRVPPGGYYHFPDYVLDLVELLDVMEAGAVHLVGHSMGGSVATYFAGALPERVCSVALLEGAGPPAMPAEVTPERFAGWLHGVRKVRSRAPRRMATLDEVVARLRVAHPTVDLGVLREVAEVAVRSAEGGGYEFRFDPLHQTPTPARFDAEAFGCFLDRITCPVLLVDGGPAGYPDLDGRGARCVGARRRSLSDAGHMMHWTRPGELAGVLEDFLCEVGA